jgi:hypothetical protein
MGFPLFTAFRVLFSILALILLGVLIFHKKLASLGSLPLRGALEVMFSFRDLRAITLLDRLKKTEDSGEEGQLLEALYDAPSALAIEGLLDKMKSPRLATRAEAIRAVGALEDLTEEAEQALMADLTTNPYTTAYLSAQILGNHGYREAIPVLRKLAASADYMLAGEAIIALARLRDEGFRPNIERIITKTKNPRLKIMGVEAFGIYGSPNSLSILAAALRAKAPPPYLLDTATLSMAAILSIENKFYPLLVRFLENPALAASIAMDEAEAAYESFMSRRRFLRFHRETGGIAVTQAKVLQEAVASYMQNSDGAPLARWILELPDDQAQELVRAVLSEIVLDDEFAANDRLKLLIAYWSASQL